MRKTTEQYRKEGGEIKHERVSVHVEKGGVLTGDKYEELGTAASLTTTICRFGTSN